MFNGPDTPPGQSGAGTSSTPNAQNILALLGKMFSASGSAMSGGGSQQGPTGTSQQQIQVPSGSAPMVPGSMAAGLPQYSPGASPVPPKSATPQGSMPAYQTGFNFPTPKARNAAVVTNTIQSLGAFADQMKQHAYQKQVEEARGVIATVLRSSLAADKAGQTGDQDTQKLIHDQANKMLGNKEAQKVLKELNKPGSAAYYGAQQAYQDIMKENEQRLNMEAIRAKMNAEAARAEMYNQQARSASPEAKKEFEAQKHEDIMGEQKQQIQAQTERQNNLLNSQMTQLDKSLKSQEKIATQRYNILKFALSENTGNKYLDALTNDSKAKVAQIKVLTDAYDKIQKDISDHPVQSMWNTVDLAQKQAQMTGIKSQIDSLSQEIEFINQKQQKAMQAGLIPDVTKITLVGPAGETLGDKPARSSSDPEPDSKPTILDPDTGQEVK